MGLLRKSLYLGTGGIVAPNSRKQKKAAQTLAAIQGASPAQVRQTGGRYDFDTVITGTPQVRMSAAARPADHRVPGDPPLLTKGGKQLRFSQTRMRAMGASTFDAARWQSRSDRWRRAWLVKHPDVAAKMFPDGYPAEGETWPVVKCMGWENPGVDMIARGLTYRRTHDIYVAFEHQVDGQPGEDWYTARKHDGAGKLIAGEHLLVDLLADLDGYVK